MGITLRVLLQANTLTLYQSTTHIILIFSPTKIYFREVKINQELVQNQQTFQEAIPTSLLLLKPVAILPTLEAALYHFHSGADRSQSHFLKYFSQLVTERTADPIIGNKRINLSSTPGGAP